MTTRNPGATDEAAEDAATVIDYLRECGAARTAAEIAYDTGIWLGRVEVALSVLLDVGSANSRCGAWSANAPIV